jgi:hypothetical protein
MDTETVLARILPKVREVLKATLAGLAEQERPTWYIVVHTGSGHAGCVAAPGPRPAASPDRGAGERIGGTGANLPGLRRHTKRSRLRASAPGDQQCGRHPRAATGLLPLCAVRDAEPSPQRAARARPCRAHEPVPARAMRVLLARLPARLAQQTLERLAGRRWWLARCGSTGKPWERNWKRASRRFGKRPRPRRRGPLPIRSILYADFHPPATFVSYPPARSVKRCT